MHRVFMPLNKRPIIRAVAGGVIIGVIGLFLPLTLYSGQKQLLQIIHNPAAYGVGLLLLMPFGIKVVLIEPGPVGSNFMKGSVLPERALDPQSPYSLLVQKVNNKNSFAACECNVT